MKRTPFIYLAAALCFIGLLGAYVAGSRTERVQGAALTNSYQTASSSLIFVGSDLPTTIATTSASRRFLKISNMSGATTTAQVLSCSYNGEAVTKYAGLIVFASTTEVLNLDNLYTGPLRCKFASATSSVTVTEI